MIAQFIDSVVGAFSPVAGARRIHARQLMKEVADRNYEAAKRDRRFNDWKTANRSADLELLADADMLRARARDLVRNNPYAKGVLSARIRNVVESGITPQSQVVLKDQPEEDSDTFNEKLEQLFDRFARECDLGGRLTFYEIQQMILSERIEAGELLIRFVEVQDRSSLLPLKIELIEADRIANDHIFPRGVNADTGNEVRRGIEIDKNGKPVAYWLYDNNPNDLNSTRLQATRHPAENFLHLFKPTRVGQTRGVTEFATVVTWMRGLEQYLSDELSASGIASKFSVAIKSLGGGADGPLLGGPGTESKDAKGNTFENLETGMVARMFPGEDISVIDPSRGHTESAAFISLMQRSVGVGADLSYERMTRDYSQTNYSSNRAGDLEDRRGFRIDQNWMIDHFCAEVWVRFVAAVVSLGLDWMPDEFEFIANFEHWTSHSWDPPGWEWVDPRKEQQASEGSVDSWQSTLRDEVSKRGRKHWRDIVKQRAKEIRLIAAELEVPVESIVNQSNSKSTNQPEKSLLEKVQEMQESETEE